MPDKDKDKMGGYPASASEPIKCRLARLELDTGEIEILCSSLIDTKQYPHGLFRELYHYRRNEEEAYKLLKSRKHDQKINRTNAISMTKDILVGVFIKKQYEKALQAFDGIVYNT